jgi:hypothetical protein
LRITRNETINGKGSAILGNTGFRGEGGVKIIVRIRGKNWGELDRT